MKSTKILGRTSAPFPTRNERSTPPGKVPAHAAASGDFDWNSFEFESPIASVSLASVLSEVVATEFVFAIDRA